MIERGTIEQINTRGRVTLRLTGRRVVADLHNGSGGSVGDLIEGEMRPGLQSWRNVRNSILSVVEVVSVEPVLDAAAGDEPDSLFGRGARSATSADNRRADAIASTPADQNSRRRFN